MALDLRERTGQRYADHTVRYGGCIVKLTPLGVDCRDGTCPTIYASDRGTIVVQGYLVADAEVNVPEGEALVEIPVELFEQTNA
jgi:hypothetical protein